MSFNLKEFFKEVRHDLPASIVVFFVAVPLCLGIALASGAPLFSGVIAGIVGGIVVGAASGSALGVSGPAAGLAVIVLNAITSLGSFEALLLAVALAGLLQIVMGYLKLGLIAHYFPTSVINGMLTGIGLIIILKQIPHAVGYDVDYEGDMDFFVGSENTFSILMKSFEMINPGALLITVISMIVLLTWEMKYFKTSPLFKFFQGPLVVVALGILMSTLYKSGALPFSLTKDQLVSLPVADSLSGFLSQFTTPDFSRLMDYKIYVVALTLALIASLETLLSVEATDKLDPLKRVTPTAKELKAQGLGNFISGMIGGLPITQVIVRSSANITFGGRTKASTIFHGCFILISALFIPTILNKIPLATLACILFVVGFNLAKPRLFKSMYNLGWNQFIPFVATVAGVVFTDLLKGIIFGFVVAIFFILRGNYMNPYKLEEEVRDGRKLYRLNLAEEASFLNKGAILKALNDVPRESSVIIDGSRTHTVDHDVVEVIHHFMVNSKIRDIDVTITALPQVYTFHSAGAH